LLTRPLVLLILISFAALFGFQLLLSVVPLYADEVGGGSSGAGLATAAFMLSTVSTQIQMPRILGRYGYGRALAAGLLFLGVPALFYAYAGTLVTILAVTLVRGVGFGVVTVVFAALIVELAPPGRRGEALGLLGLAITLPTVFCNALGLWLAGRFGFEVVFLLGGFSPLLGLIMIPGIRFVVTAREDEEGGAGFFAGLGRAPLRRIFLLFAATTMAAGVIVTCRWRCQARGFSPRRVRSSSSASCRPQAAGGADASATAGTRASCSPPGSSPARSGWRASRSGACPCWPGPCSSGAGSGCSRTRPSSS
jgi:MFS family permease